MPTPTTHDMTRVLILVPCKDERDSIGPLVDQLTRTLPDADVLVIDDGSTDDTLLRVPATAHVLSLPFNLGIGGAMQAGYRYAALHGYHVAVQVDGDGQHRPMEVEQLLKTMRGQRADLVVGSRFLGEARYRQTLGRRWGGMLLNNVIRLLSGLTISDSTSGFRAARRPVIEAFAHWYPEDYPEPEVLLLLKRAGFSIAETPVTMRQRKQGRTSISFVRGLYYVMKVSLCLALDTLRDPWPAGKVPRTTAASAKTQPAPDPLAAEGTGLENEETRPATEAVA